MNNFSFHERRKSILEIQKLLEKNAKILNDLQKDCAHEKVIATIYLGENFNSVYGICLFCNLKEGGHDKSLNKLKDKPIKWLSNNAFEKFEKELGKCDPEPKLLPLNLVNKLKGFKTTLPDKEMHKLEKEVNEAVGALSDGPYD